MKSEIFEIRCVLSGTCLLGMSSMLLVLLGFDEVQPIMTDV